MNYNPFNRSNTALSSQRLQLVNVDTEFKLSKLKEIATNDRELIDLQRKTIYL
jgi:hypothetical protein